ncbi:hypothetical protein ACWEQ8_05130 [Streptomyces noursei]
MTRDDGDWPRSELDDVEAGSWVWSRGVDYLSGWRQARESAERLNHQLVAVGLDPSSIRAAASTDAEGGGIVHIKATLPGSDQLTDVLTRMASRQGEVR